MVTLDFFIVKVEGERFVRKQIAMLVAMVAVVGVMGIVGAAAPEVSIKQAMAKIAGKKGGALPKVKGALNAASPDWSEIKKSTKIIADNSAAIVDATPEKGEKANYEKLAAALAANGKALNEAAEKEDATAAKAALGKIGTSCKTCHDAHRGK